MPPKKVKDETKNTKTDTDSINPNLKLQSTPDVQVQNTKFDGIVLLSPAAQQLQKDLDSAIKDNISSTTKQKHGSINHLRMRELMEPDKGVDELEENLVDKLKASILVDVQGIREEIVSSFNSAAYDILQDVLGVHLPKVIQENETLKSMLGTISAQVSNLQKEIFDLKKKLQPSVFTEQSQLGQNPPFQNDFVINVKSQTSQPVPAQTFQGGSSGYRLNSTKNKTHTERMGKPQRMPRLQRRIFISQTSNGVRGKLSCSHELTQPGKILASNSTTHPH